MVPGAWTGRNKSGRWLKAQGQARDCRMPGSASRPRACPLASSASSDKRRSRSIPDTARRTRPLRSMKKRPEASSLPMRSLKTPLASRSPGPVSPRLTRSARIASRAESDCSRSSNNTKLCSTRKSGPSSSTRADGPSSDSCSEDDATLTALFSKSSGDSRRVRGSAVISELQADPNSPKSTASARREGAQMRAALVLERFNAGGRGRLSAHPNRLRQECGRL